jgi:hypothetical protein
MMGENWNNCDLLRATLSELVGHLGNWLRTRPVELGHVINFLYANLAFPRQSVNGSAARSMRRLCIKCGAQLGEPLLGLYDQVCMHVYLSVCVSLTCISNKKISTLLFFFFIFFFFFYLFIFVSNKT